MAALEDKKFYFLSRDLNDIFYYPEDRNINRDFHKLIMNINESFDNTILKTGVLFYTNITRYGSEYFSGFGVQKKCNIKEITDDYIVATVDDTFNDSKRVYFAVPLFNYNEDSTIKSLMFVILVAATEANVKALAQITKIKTTDMVRKIYRDRMDELNDLSEVNLFWHDKFILA